MSFVYYDGAIVPRIELNRATQVYKRFHAVWPKTSINGVAVYNKSMLFYVGYFRTDKTFKKFIKCLGMSWEEFISQSVDNEIETMYFYLKGGFKYSGERALDDPILPSSNSENPSNQMITDTLNEEFNTGDEIEVTISYGGALKRYVASHSLTYDILPTGISASTLNTAQIRQTLAGNPWYYYANSRHKPYTTDNLQFQLYDGSGTNVGTSGGKATPESTPVCTVSSTISYMGVLALVDNGSVFEPVVDSNGDPIVFDEKISTVSGSGGEVINYTYTLKFIYKGCTNSSNILNGIQQWYEAHYNDFNDIPVGTAKDPRITSQIDTRIKRVLADMKYNPDLDYLSPADVEDSLYYHTPSNMFFLTQIRSKQYDSYLKVDAVKAMKKREFVKLISTQLATDYTVESKDWWESLLAFVIIVIAVVAAFFTQQWYIVKFAGDAGVLLASYAAAAGAAAMTISIGSMILAEVGGLSAQGLVKMLGAFAAIVGYFGAMLGIFSFYNRVSMAIAAENAELQMAESGMVFTSEAAYNTAVQEALKQVTLVDVLKHIVVEQVNSALSTITNVFTSSSNMSVSSVANTVMDTVKVAVKIKEYMNDQEKAKLDKEYMELEKEQEKYEEEILNKPYVQSAGVYRVLEEEASNYDVLENLGASIEEKIGKDARFSMWEANTRVS